MFTNPFSEGEPHKCQVHIDKFDVYDESEMKMLSGDENNKVEIKEKRRRSKHESFQKNIM